MYNLFKILGLLVAWFDLLLMSILLYLLSWLPWKGKHPVSYLFHTWSRCFVRALNIDLRLHQKYLGKLPERYILVANHPSAFEDVGIPALFDVVSLAKSQVQNWFLVGRISRAAGTMYVDRDDPDSRQAAIEVMLDTLNTGQSIALYPEGGCKGRRLFTEFKSGAFDVSIQSGVPIVPVFLHYEAQQDFEWQDPYTLMYKLWHMLTAVNNRANYYVFDPIDPKDFADKYEMKAYVYNKYQHWNRQYLE